MALRIEKIELEGQLETARDGTLCLERERTEIQAEKNELNEQLISAQSDSI